LEVLKAGLGGVLDTATLGVFDLAAAGVDTLRGKGSYRANLAIQKAHDEHDARAHPWARRTGMAVGAVAPFLLPGGGALSVAKAATTLGPRAIAKAGLAGLKAAGPAAYAKAGRMAESQLGHLARVGAATGAASSAVGQAASNGLTGTGSAKDIVTASVGGAVGGAAAPFIGPVLGGFASGVAIPTAQALANARLPDLDALYEGGLGGLGASRLGTAASARGLAKLRADATAKARSASGRQLEMNRATGKLGERLSELDAMLRFQSVTGRQTKIRPKEATGRGGHTFADLVTDNDVVEAKFGSGARLSKAQRMLKAQLDADATDRNYLIQQWLKKDLDAFGASGAAGLLASPRRRDEY
jgi:hypothetical protein